MQISDIISEIELLGYTVKSNATNKGTIRFEISSQEYYSEFLITEEVIIFFKLVHLEKLPEFLTKIQVEYKKWELLKDNTDLPIITLSNVNFYF